MRTPSSLVRLLLVALVIGLCGPVPAHAAEPAATAGELFPSRMDAVAVTR